MTPARLILSGKRYVVIEHREYERLRTLARTAEKDIGLPVMPQPDEHGNYPAIETGRAILARKIIKRRWAVQMTQAELARRAGIRPETLNRIEKAVTTPSIATVQKIVAALERAQRDAKDE